jgi:hypothetical protein
MEEEETKPSYTKRPLWQWLVLYTVIAIVIYGLVYYFVLAKKGTAYSPTSSTVMKVTPSSVPTPAKQKFSDSEDFQFGYKIFPGTVSTESKQAMAGFAFTTSVMSDGSTQITLTAQNPYYKTQQYVVKPGYSLYFIEKNIKDDDPEKDTDTKTLDDTAILVDPQGYIVQ